MNKVFNSTLNANETKKPLVKSQPFRLSCHSSPKSAQFSNTEKGIPKKEDPLLRSWPLHLSNHSTLKDAPQRILHIQIYTTCIPEKETTAP